MRQVPLRLGWGRSIHAAQGTELDEVDVDLSRQFGAHQAYVALSRVKSVKGLRLVARSSRADQKVRVLVQVLQAAFCVRERLMNRIRLVWRAGGTVLMQAGSAPCEVVVGRLPAPLVQQRRSARYGRTCLQSPFALLERMRARVRVRWVRAWVCASEFVRGLKIGDLFVLVAQFIFLLILRLKKLGLDLV